LVGKGVTFDSGGLNIKSAASMMDDMYLDKTGACAVFGALLGTIDLKIKKNIIFSMGFAENAVDAHSYKPGDIMTSLKGLTIENSNTDAEGRLVLADTMTYVQREFKPKRLIDIATLTGAVMAALGKQTAGVYSNDDQFAYEIKDRAKEVFEPFWHLPITEEAKSDILSSVADFTNSAKSAYGRANQAAAFLLNFVEEGVKWAHLDIAGPAILVQA
jgi:leucyl aminopeptidase